MAESSHSIYRIDPLQGADDYSVWKVKMLDILTDLGLNAYIGDSPPISTEATKAVDHSGKDRKALSTIRLRVANGPLVHIAKAKKAKEAWTTLKNLYEAAGAIGIVSSCRNFFRAQCDDGSNIVEHIQTMRGYQAELADLGHAISASDFSVTLLTSLPKSWNAFIGSIDLSLISDAADPDSSKIIACILEEDRRLRDQGTSSDSVLIAKSRGKLKCYLCDKTGHMIRDCPKKKAFDNFNADSSKTTAGLAYSGSDNDDTDPEFTYVF